MSDWDQVWSSEPHRQKGIIFRSPLAKGKILGYSYAPLPPEVTLLLPRDIPGSNTFQVLKGKMPLLAEDQVRYPGEPLALACSSDLRVLSAWAPTFRAIMAPEEPVFNPGQSREISRKRQGLWGTPVPEEEGDILVEDTLVSGSQDPGDFAPLRVQVVKKDKAYHVECSHQWPRLILDNLAKALDLDQEQVCLHVPETRPFLDSRLWYPAWMATAAALLAQASGRGVELELTKEEEFLYLPKRPEGEYHFKARLSADGTLKSLEVDFFLGWGAYSLLDGEVLDRTFLGFGALYTLPCLKLTGEVRLTNSPPRGPVGTWGEGLSLTALELFLRQVAEKAHLEPVPWKKRYLQAPHQSFFTGGMLKDHPPLITILEALVQKTDHHRRYAAAQALVQSSLRTEDRRYRRGTGLALGFQGTGFLTSGTVPSGLLARRESPQKVVLSSSLLPQQTRTQKVWKTRAGEILGLAPENIHWETSLKTGDLDGGPTVLSRRGVLGWSLLEQACLDLSKKKGARYPQVVEKTFRRARHLVWNGEEFTGVPFVGFSWAGAVAEGEWDTVLSQFLVRKITLVVDAGPLYDPVGAESELRSGVRACLGWCLTENFSFVNGLPSREQYRSYRLTRAPDWPEIQIHFLPPQGKKDSPRGLGELPWSCVPGAVLTAASQALGHPLRHWPLSRQDFPEGYFDH